MEYIGKTFFFETFDNGVFVVVQHPRLSPSDEDFNIFLKEAKKSKIRHMIVYSRGPHPNAKQRKEWGKLFSDIKELTGKTPIFACIAPSFSPVVVLGIVSLVLGYKVKAFSPSDWLSAMKYVDIPIDIIYPALKSINKGADIFNIPNIGKLIISDSQLF
jgi:hypothetical protein